MSEVGVQGALLQAMAEDDQGVDSTVALLMRSVSRAPHCQPQRDVTCNLDTHWWWWWWWSINLRVTIGVACHPSECRFSWWPLC